MIVISLFQFCILFKIINIRFISNEDKFHGILPTKQNELNPFLNILSPNNHSGIQYQDEAEVEEDEEEVEVEDAIKLYHFDVVDITFNNTSLSKSNQKLHFDIGIIVDQTIIDILNVYHIDYMKFFENAVNEIKAILSWNNIEIRIISLEVATIQFFLTFENVISQIYKFYNLRKEKFTDATFFIHLFPFSFPFHNKANYFCTNNSFFILTFRWEFILKYKLFAESILMTIFDMITEKSHDDSLCECPYNYDILCLSKPKEDEFTELDWPPKTFINCTIKYFIKQSFKNPCLFFKINKPDIFPSCGNGVLEAGEQCDCGDDFQCLHTGQIECCDIKECRFKDTSFQCSNGPCCENCKFIKNKVCRNSFGECDPEERCNGNSSECSPDIIYENWALCNKNVGYCLNGMCTNHYEMCKYVYGTDEIYFNQACFDTILNIIQDQCLDVYHSKDIDPFCNINDSCKLFVCASSKLIDNDNLIIFSKSNYFCIIPKAYLLLGSLTLAPNYVKCVENINGFCYNSMCTDNKTILKNCVDDICYDINNQLKYMMTKEIPLDSHGFVKMNLGIYTLTIIKVLIPEIIGISIIVYIVIGLLIPLIIILITLYLLRKKSLSRNIGNISKIQNAEKHVY